MGFFVLAAVEKDIRPATGAISNQPAGRQGVTTYSRSSCRREIPSCHFGERNFRCRLTIILTVTLRRWCWMRGCEQDDTVSSMPWSYSARSQHEHGRDTFRATLPRQSTNTAGPTTNTAAANDTRTLRNPDVCYRPGQLLTLWTRHVCMCQCSAVRSTTTSSSTFESPSLIGEWVAKTTEEMPKLWHENGGPTLLVCSCWDCCGDVRSPL